jgi:polyisoprenoid-binding protein YceI
MINPARAFAAAVSLAAALAGGPALAQAISTDYAAAPAGTYTLDPAHTSVTLKVSHLGLSNYTFRMKGVRGGFSFDPAHPEASKLTVEIDANSADTGDPALDRQIAGEVLEATRYPTIRFVSTAVKPGPEGRGEVVGDLTLHGQTHPVTLDVIFNGFGQVGPEHALRMGFSGDATVKRSDFGATKYAPMVGDEVSVVVETEFQK